MTNSFLSALRDSLLPSRWISKERAEAERAQLVAKRLTGLLGQPREQEEQLPPESSQQSKKNNAA